MKEKQLVCSHCGATLTEETKREFDGEIMCEHCLHEQTTICDCCGTRVWHENTESDNFISICMSCYDNSYTRCEECRCIIRTDDARYYDDYPYCDDCYDKLDDGAIKTYDYKPEPIFYGSGDLFYGVELEIDSGGECNSNAKTLLEVANSNSEHLYCKHDGSIDDGFEMVSHPASLYYHISGIDWLEIFNRAIQMGYRSHNTSTCGLHIHVSRSAFGATQEEQEIVIARIVHFVEKH